MEIHFTHLRYLVVIYQLAETGRGVSSVDVAHMLRVTKPSVTHMLETMRQKGWVKKERYGKIELTEEGTRLAESYMQQLERLSAYFPAMGLRLERDETLLAATALYHALPERYQGSF